MDGGGDFIAVDRRIDGPDCRSKHAVFFWALVGWGDTFCLCGFGVISFSWLCLSSGFGGFLAVHLRNASSNYGKSQSCQLSSVRTR